jgi:hypothetical protein
VNAVNMALCRVATTGKVELNGILWAIGSTRELLLDSSAGFTILLVTVPTLCRKSGSEPTTTFTQNILVPSGVQACVISTGGLATHGYERKTQHIQNTARLATCCDQFLV